MNNDQMLVRGGTPLRGAVTVPGAKNAAPKITVAALLAAGVSRLTNVPDIRDTGIVRGLLQAYGAQTSLEDGRLTIDASELRTPERETVRALAGTSRIPVLFCGPLLHRLGQAYIPGLGGCLIGARPVDLHVKVLRDFGALIEETADGGLLARAPRRLRGTDIELPYPSVGATEQVLLTAVGAHGSTLLTNAAIEPEIIDLIHALQKMGARIEFTGDRDILITGRDDLNGYAHRVMTDRIEVGSWASVALATDGEIEVRGAAHGGMVAFLSAFQEAGGSFEITEAGMIFRRSTSQSQHRSQIVETGVHPRFQTDWQQPLLAALTQRPGTTIVHETVWDSRLLFTDDLNRMGADIEVRQGCTGRSPCRFANGDRDHTAIIRGGTPLTGADIEVPDLRGGFALLTAALAAKGESRLRGTALLSRGYEDLLGKLHALGADVS